MQRTYCYDPNGNVYSASGSNVTYTGVTWYVANLAKRITRSTNEWAEFTYDPNRARFKQLAQLNASTSETTIYVGSIYEKRTQSANVEHVHYIRDGNDTVAVFKRKSGGVLQTRYLHRDHLGSVVATTTDTGAVEERFSFDAWGKRRHGLTVNNTVGANHWTGPSAGSFMTLASSFTHRGYTGHEHIDHIGLVNMNGRVYDPEIGRFLSADPSVQFPLSTQGFNRYTYTGNNPLSYFDPSGFSFWKKLMQIVGIVLNFIPGFQGWSTAFVRGLVTGFLASGGDAKMAVLGGIGGAVFGKFGKWYELGKIDGLQKAFLHGLAGGALNLAAGGRFGEGFLGAFAGAYASVELGKATWFKEWAGVPGDGDALGLVKRTAVAAVVGGTASRLGGGKFQNGAVTAAFAHLFNAESAAERLLRNQDQHASGVEKVRAKLMARGYEVLTEPEIPATLDGVTYGRRYDLVAYDRKSDMYFGVEVKSTRTGNLQLVQRQLAFDAQVVANGATTATGITITGVIYMGVDFRTSYLSGGARWQGIRLREMLVASGIKYDDLGW